MESVAVFFGKRVLLMINKLALLVFIPMLAVLTLSGCAQLDDEPTDTGETQVIAIAQLKQETNVFSPVKTTLEDFEARGLLYGDEILKSELGGDDYLKCRR